MAMKISKKDVTDDEPYNIGDTVRVAVEVTTHPLWAMGDEATIFSRCKFDEGWRYVIRADLPSIAIAFVTHDKIELVKRRGE